MKGKPTCYEAAELTVLNRWRGAGREPEQVPAFGPPNALKSPPPPPKRLVGRRVHDEGGGG